MRSIPGFGLFQQLAGRLKRKWADFWGDVFVSIAEEEMRVRREEFDTEVGTHQQHE